MGMFDESYGGYDDLTEIQILLKISADIEDLIRNNDRLKMQNRIYSEQRCFQREGDIELEDLAVYGKNLVGFLLDFLEKGFFTKDDSMRLRLRMPFSEISHFESGEQLFEQLEGQIKDIFEWMIDIQRKHIDVHRNVLKDVKYLLEDYI